MLPNITLVVQIVAFLAETITLEPGDLILTGTPSGVGQAMDPPRFLARTPHGYHEPRQIRDELEAAGFSNISVDTIQAVSKSASPLDPAIARGNWISNERRIESNVAAQLTDTVAAPTAYSKTSAHPIIQATSSPMVAYEYV